MSWAYAIALLFILVSIYYLVLAASIYFDDRKSKPRKRYVFAAVFLAVWSLSKGMMTIAADEESARLFWSAGYFSFCLFLPCWISFLFHLTSYNKKYAGKTVLSLILILSASAFFCVTKGDVTLVKTNYGYQYLYSASPPFIIASVLCGLSFLIMLFLQTYWMKNARLTQHKKHAFRFAALTFIFGMPVYILEFLIPVFYARPVLPLSCVFIVFISVQLDNVMKAHRIINITARDISEDIFSYVSQPILALSPDNRVVLANKAAMDFWGSDIAGRNIAELVTVNGERPRQEYFNENLNVDYGITVLSGGKNRKCGMVFSVVRDKYNDIVNKIAVLNDITDLRNAAQREREANQMKTRFLASMSHEIRTPMNAVIGMAELALREKSPEAKNERISEVKQAAVNLLSIINGILDFSKIESGKLEIINAEFSLSSLINDVINIIRMRVLNTRIRFAASIDCNIPGKLIGDETRLRQILINLLGNAVKYTKEGFVSLVIFGRQKDIKNIELYFIVRDSGIGIKEEDLGDLFKDYSRLDRKKNRSIEGAGLGLAITHNIVKAMGGKITAESEYGKGSVFTAALALKYNSPEPLAEVIDPDTRNVLIYERREANADSILFTVDNLGVNHTLVGSDSDLLRKMETEAYNFLFISYDLYRKNRREIANFGNKMEIVILSDFGEIVFESNLNVLSMPVYCAPVADILNRTAKRFSYNDTKNRLINFTSPGARVLLVDDMSVNLKVAEGLLRLYEFQIDSCESGKEAVEAVKTNKYDLVFMDNRMPDIDGIEAVKQIREWEKTLPIIALTADAVADNRDKFLKNGFNDYLLKPIDTVKLNEILEKWIPKEKQLEING